MLKVIEGGLACDAQPPMLSDDDSGGGGSRGAQMARAMVLSALTLSFGVMTILAHLFLGPVPPVFLYVGLVALGAGAGSALVLRFLVFACPLPRR